VNSLTIKEFEKSLITFTNQAPLPTEVKRLVFADILRQLEIAVNEEVNEQMILRQAEEKENEENELHKDNME
jgi:hypothetical protein